MLLPKRVLPRVPTVLSHFCHTQVLKGWYDHRYPADAEPVPPSTGSQAKRAKRMQTGTRPPLVIVLQDFEAFEAQVLADFVTVCSHQRVHLPIFLVMGVASTPDVVHR